MLIAAAGSSPRSENHTPGMPVKISDKRPGCATLISSFRRTLTAASVLMTGSSVLVATVVVGSVLGGAAPFPGVELLVVGLRFAGDVSTLIGGNAPKRHGDE